MNKTHNFGIELTKKVAEAHNIDKKNSNTLWANAIVKDMNNVNIDFDIMTDGEHVLNGYNQIHCHMIFNMKMEDLRCKVRLVADRKMTKTPKCQT